MILTMEKKLLAKVIKFLTNTIDQGLNYVPLDMPSARLVLLTDASFENAKGLLSQLRFLLLMGDRNGDCNDIHYVSSRCKRVVRSVIAAELFTLVVGYDSGYTVSHLIEELTNHRLPLEALVDS